MHILSESRIIPLQAPHPLYLSVQSFTTNFPLCFVCIPERCNRPQAPKNQRRLLLVLYLCIGIRKLLCTRQRGTHSLTRFTSTFIMSNIVALLQELRNNISHSPPLDSSGSSVNSESNSESASSAHDDKPSENDTDVSSDSHDLVTCYCGKPFAGRPMIECSLCLTWIHLSCARIKKSNIPDVSG